MGLGGLPIEFYPLTGPLVVSGLGPLGLFLLLGGEFLLHSLGELLVLWVGRVLLKLVLLMNLASSLAICAV